MRRACLLQETWWEKNNFRAGARYLVGKPITVEHCQQVLNTGFQRQRRAAALELALLQKNWGQGNINYAL